MMRGRGPRPGRAATRQHALILNDTMRPSCAVRRQEYASRRQAGARRESAAGCAPPTIPPWYAQGAAQQGARCRRGLRPLRRRHSTCAMSEGKRAGRRQARCGCNSRTHSCPVLRRAGRHDGRPPRRGRRRPRGGKVRAQAREGSPLRGKAEHPALLLDPSILHKRRDRVAHDPLQSPDLVAQEHPGQAPAGNLDKAARVHARPL